MALCPGVAAIPEGPAAGRVTCPASSDSSRAWPQGLRASPGGLRLRAMRTPFLLVATTAFLLLAAIPAQAQDVGIQNPEESTHTILYFHVINVQDMPINTQIPNDEF